ncbi:SMI1/KNR4 family protein [Paenibacillus campi]|uniref:SMI1/KNR4 family protein n=1 Tax=Paenibacillus campi TaxID=3106031 RepID=UPI002B001930|nr:SMI1/KNR4 family protein [Paenibacillus sp. SGZ-1014]
MYIVSSYRHICSAAELDGIEQQYQVKLPEGYRQFLQQYGQGTYCDWFHVNMPDAERLQQFAEYGLWEHEQDSPITATQLRDCVVIASTVDGDMLALHSDVKGGLWLPRHSEQIMAVSSWQELSWQAFMNGELQRLYKGAPTSLERQCYFEPWNGRQQHEFVCYSHNMLLCMSQRGLSSPLSTNRLICAMLQHRLPSTMCRHYDWKIRIGANYFTASWKGMFVLIMRMGMKWLYFMSQ